MDSKIHKCILFHLNSILSILRLYRHLNCCSSLSSFSGRIPGLNYQKLLKIRYSQNPITTLTGTKENKNHKYLQVHDFFANCLSFQRQTMLGTSFCDVLDSRRLVVAVLKIKPNLSSFLFLKIMILNTFINLYIVSSDARKMRNSYLQLTKSG